MTALALSDIELDNHTTLYGTPLSSTGWALPCDDAISLTHTLESDYSITDVSNYLALEQLEVFEQLEDDWDCEGAHRIHEGTISHCKKVISRLQHSISRAEMTPNSNGTISFEWSSSFGNAHLEVGKEKFSFYLKPKSGEIVYAQGETRKWSNSFFANSLDTMLLESLFPNPATHQISKIILTAASAAAAAAYYTGGIYSAVRSASSLKQLVY